MKAQVNKRSDSWLVREGFDTGATVNIVFQVLSYKWLFVHDQPTMLIEL
jgi:hypothetical protein